MITNYLKTDFTKQYRYILIANIKLSEFDTHDYLIEMYFYSYLTKNTVPKHLTQIMSMDIF